MEEVSDTNSSFRSQSLELIGSFHEISNEIIEKLSCISSIEQDGSFKSELLEVIEDLQAEL
ncbi:hypothetical protein JL49_14205 [Pseudoalteromonas luteoviolacea]|uniref:Uncharacterized protein n=2 Tax=Pseudoalteromonas luteoviolacea TaxID=43657 RepID=A0A167HAL0_9GAMM|nr:hypothetical protein N482_23230 [Pseudoalteromonas luteoviolacea NCIMB 1942]KZW99982.1 hypothetical protein JL49_14205 [Pseudoalteromonas luteoviolacea]